MVINSKEVLDELLASDPEAKREWDATFKLKNDPRVTKIGGFLRRTSLDELPQLFNVLKGEMSLVGPRPIITAELERYNEEVDYYLLSKPGMTGLWQVSGRSDVDYETRVYLDAWYVKNWSMWNDIAILFKTVGVVLKKMVHINSASLIKKRVNMKCFIAIPTYNGGQIWHSAVNSIKKMLRQIR